MTTEQKPVVAWLVRRKDWPVGTYGAQVGEVRPTWADEAFPLFLPDSAAERGVTDEARKVAGLLEAMAHNYANGHSWDHLDGEAVTKAAKLLRRAALTATGAAQGDGASARIAQLEAERDAAGRQCQAAWEEVADLKRMLNDDRAQQEAPAAQPLTDEQRRALWRASEFRGNGGQIDWFIEGTRAAERHHRIGAQPAATKVT